MRGSGEPFIVHNCIQGIARIVLTDQMLEIRSQLLNVVGVVRSHTYVCKYTMQLCVDAKKKLRKKFLKLCNTVWQKHRSGQQAYLLVLTVILLNDMGQRNDCLGVVR